MLNRGEACVMRRWRWAQIGAVSMCVFCVFVWTLLYCCPLIMTSTLITQHSCQPTAWHQADSMWRGLLEQPSSKIIRLPSCRAQLNISSQHSVSTGWQPEPATYHIHVTHHSVTSPSAAAPSTDCTCSIISESANAFNWADQDHPT